MFPSWPDQFVAPGSLPTLLLDEVVEIQLHPAARDQLRALLMAGYTRLYRSAETGEWMICQVLARLDAAPPKYAYKTLRHWILEFAQSQP